MTTRGKVGARSSRWGCGEGHWRDFWTVSKR